MSLVSTDGPTPESGLIELHRWSAPRVTLPLLIGERRAGMSGRAVLVGRVYSYGNMATATKMQFEVRRYVVLWIVQ